MFEWFWAYFASRRLKLRDRGPCEIFVRDGKPVVWAHSSCQTRVRIGITAAAGACKYCWRCEEILGTSVPSGGPNGGGEDEESPPAKLRLIASKAS